MREPTAPADVERSLRKVAQLRTLFRRLPHVPTPHERRLLEEFRAFAAGQREAVSAEAARVGARAAWRAGEHAELASALLRLPEELRERDATLATFAYLTAEALRSQH